MTTFPKKPADKVAATIRNAVAKTKVHAAKISQLESASNATNKNVTANTSAISTADTNITTNANNISTLSTTVSDLLSGNVTVGGNLTVNGTNISLDGNNLGATKLAFLVSLGQMNSIGSASFTGLGSAPAFNSGNMQTINNTLNALVTIVNDIISELGNSNYMN